MILDNANCTSVEGLRGVSESIILHLNNKLINNVAFDAGGGVLGPAPGFGTVVDGTFISDIPPSLFQKGWYHKQLRSLVVGNVTNKVRQRKLTIICR